VSCGADGAGAVIRRQVHAARPVDGRLALGAVRGAANTPGAVRVAGSAEVGGRVHELAQTADFAGAGGGADLHAGQTGGAGGGSACAVEAVGSAASAVAGEQEGPVAAGSAGVRAFEEVLAGLAAGAEAGSSRAGLAGAVAPAAAGVLVHEEAVCADSTGPVELVDVLAAGAGGAVGGGCDTVGAVWVAGLAGAGGWVFELRGGAVRGAEWPGQREAGQTGCAGRETRAGGAGRGTPLAEKPADE